MSLTAAQRGHLRSWIIWTAWIVFGLAWELWCVFREKRNGDEPLTRVARDRLMKSKHPWISYPIRFVVLSFLGYLAFHWLGQVPW